MYVENANRAVTSDIITPDNVEPESKNPIIASFFRNIWLADELGSGVRRLYHYVPRYSGKVPEFIDGDIFRIIVPLDDEYSYEVGRNKMEDSSGRKRSQAAVSGRKRSQAVVPEERKLAIMNYLKEYGRGTTPDFVDVIGLSAGRIRTLLREMVEDGTVDKNGDNRFAYYTLKKQ